MSDRINAGAEWVKSALKVADISPLGVEVADLLGDLFDGIYHLEEKALRRVKWSDPYIIEITIMAYGSWATYDFDHLTRLVVLSHDRMIRASIQPCNFTHFKLMFHKRLTREGSIMERMPTMEDHVAQIRGLKQEASYE